MNITVILSGGVGQRFGSDKPKQYHALCGREIIAYPFDAAQKSKQTDVIVISASEKLNYPCDYCPSGVSHNDTVQNALDFVSDNYPSCEKIVFLDSVRPFVTAELIDRYYKGLDDYEAVFTAQKVTDSLGMTGSRFVERSEYFLIQKPEAFRFRIIREYFSASSEKTAIVQQLPEDCSVLNYYDFHHNMKITYPEDLFVAEQLIKARGYEI